MKFTKKIYERVTQDAIEHGDAIAYAALNGIDSYVTDAYATLYGHDSYVTDIDVPSDATEFRFIGDKTYTGIKYYYLLESRKSFPNIRKIYIDEYVRGIQIRNQLFPNVEEIVSDNDTFQNIGTGMLMRITGKNTNRLLNTFCKKPGALIDMKGITAISSLAFDGCKSANIINLNLDEVSYDADAFKGYEGADGLPVVDGVHMLGNTVMEVCDRVPDSATSINNSLDFSGRTLIVHDISIISKMYRRHQPDKIVIDNDGVISPNNLRAVLRDASISDIEISSGNPYYSVYDGMVYNRDRTYLFGCPAERTGKVVIPDGVKEINKSAFSGCSKITDIIIPDSVTEIGECAFASTGIKSFTIGKGIDSISESMFSSCSDLTDIKIPAHIKKIGKYAFTGIRIRSIELPEGLTEIDARAFVFNPDSNYETKVVLPLSLKKLNEGSFYGVKHIVVKTDNNGMLPRNLFSAIGRGNDSTNRLSTKLTVDGKDYLIPFAGVNLSKWDEYFKMIPFDEDIIWHLYQDIDCSEPSFIRKFLIELYPTINNPKVKAEIGKKLRSLQRSIFRMCLYKTKNSGIKEDDKSNDQLLITYLSYNLCTESALKTLANDADKLCRTDIKAYALQAISNLNDSKNDSSFKL